MAQAIDVIRHSLTVSRDFLGLVIKDLTPQEWVAQPAHGGNPAAFTLGHLIAVERMAVDMMKLPAPSVPSGFLQQFSRNSKPPADPKAYGDPLQLYPLFVAHRNLVIEALPMVPESLLNSPVDLPPGLTFKIFSTVAERLNFLGVHTYMHAGQLTMTRRSFGRAPLL